MRILVITFGNIIFEHVVASMRKLGHEVKVLDGKTTHLKELQDAVENFDPRFTLIYNLDLLSLNRDGPAFEEWMSAKKRAFVTWQFESPHFSGGGWLVGRWLYGPYPKDIYFLTTDTGWLDFFHSRKVAADYLPLGVDPALKENPFDPSHGSYDQTLAYSGSPFFNNPPKADSDTMMRGVHIHMQRHHFRAGGFVLNGESPEKSRELLEHLDRESIPLLDKFFSELYFDCQSYLEAKAKLREQLIALSGPKLTEIWDMLFIPRLDPIYSYYQVSVYLQRLLSKGIKIYGGDDWAKLLGLPANETRRLTFEELSRLYRHSKIIFYHTKHTFKNFVHDRVLAILGHGGFPLTDYRGDFDKLFEPGEVALYRNFDEAIELIDRYSNDDKARIEMIRRGQKRVLENHTYFHRTQKLLQLVSNHYGF